MKNVRPELLKGQLRRRVSGNFLIEIRFKGNGTVSVNFDASAINEAIWQIQGPIRRAIEELEDFLEMNATSIVHIGLASSDQPIVEFDKTE